MNRPKAIDIVADAFFDNFSGAAIFGRLRIPGSPREIVDPRPLEQFSDDEIRSGSEDMRKETSRIVDLVGAEQESLISKEAVQSLLDGWSESSLKPLEKLYHSR
jgi:hypothetical protein